MCSINGHVRSGLNRAGPLRKTCVNVGRTCRNSNRNTFAEGSDGGVGRVPRGTTGDILTRPVVIVRRRRELLVSTYVDRWTDRLYIEPDQMARTPASGPR